MGRRGPKQMIDVAKAARLYRSGLDLRQVGDRLGFSMSGIYRCLVRSGEPLRPVGSSGRAYRTVGPGTPVAAARRTTGITLVELGRRLNVTKQRAAQIERSSNLDRPTLLRIARALGCPVERLIP